MKPYALFRASPRTLTPWAAMLALTVLGACSRQDEGSAAASAASVPASAARPALSVAVVAAQSATWPKTISANGNIAAWQEAVIGAEAAGLRLTEVRVNVGDRVRRGDVLAQLQRDTVLADLAAIRANLAEAQAVQADAHANAERARQLQPTGVMSNQQIQQYLTAEQTARARMDSLTARLAVEDLRLVQTKIVAPDDGVISARAATVGAVVQAGQELFRLIRQNRLEWRAEVPQTDLDKLKPGMPASLTLASGAEVSGVIRVVAPTVDPVTRNGLVYVDLRQAASAKPGMFATGSFSAGAASAQTLPQSAVIQREGFSYVYVVGADARVTQVKVQVGRRLGERVEVISGLPPGAQIVAAGGGFLSDGDVVRVVPAMDAKLPAQAG